MESGRPAPEFALDLIDMTQKASKRNQVPIQPAHAAIGPGAIELTAGRGVLGTAAGLERELSQV